MSEAIQRMSIRATLAGHWQVPVLVLGVTVFAVGLTKVSTRRPTVSFEVSLERIEFLRSADALTRASAYTLSLLDDPERPTEQQAILHAQLAGIIHQAEVKLTRHDPRNVAAIIANYAMSAELGGQILAADLVAWGDAFRWSNQPEEAIRAYRRALASGAPGHDRLRRLIVELSLGGREEPAPEFMDEVDAILADSSASPGNYLWAMKLKVGRLARQGDLAGAMTLIARAKDRLSGTEERLAVAYSEAVCLREAGLVSAAEELLHELRASWRVHDALWARAGWLLGQIQQADGRPQAALNYYEEVLRAFQSGEVYERCIVGRAECLASLERYEASLEVFTELRDRLLAKGPPSVIHSEAVRGTLTSIGESLVADGRLLLGAEFLELGSSLVDPRDTAARALYVSRRAETLSRLARRMAAGEFGGDALLSGEAKGDLVLTATRDTFKGAELTESNNASSLFVKAAEQYLVLADLHAADEPLVIRALKAAADNFEAAGESEKVLATLTRLVRAYPASVACGDAYLRMARVHHAEARFDEAIFAYRQVIEAYPRTPPALQAMVPLADCLMTVGGASALEGEALLIDILDDRARDPIFSPQAIEYRAALFYLAEYYVKACPELVPDHLEKAIRRLEDAIAMYPEDPQIPRLRFLLADSYRASAAAVREEAKSLVSPLAQAGAMIEAESRLERALAAYDRVIGLLAAEDDSSLSALARSYLRASYLYRGDCLFDLARYAEAMIAYREAAWRYENLPTAIAAMLQIVHCHERLGETEEARAALARLGWLLKKTPPSAFEAEPGMSSKAYWEGLVARLERTGLN